MIALGSSFLCKVLFLSILISVSIYEPRYEKIGFLHMRKQRRRSASAAFVSATWKVQSLNFLNPKFQASSHLLWLYSLVCVGPGRKPRIPVSHNEAHMIICWYHIIVLPGMTKPRKQLDRLLGNIIIFLCLIGPLLMLAAKFGP